MAKTLDLTPTWESMVRFFLTLLTEQPNNKELLNTTIAHFMQQAQIADMYTELAKEAGMNPAQVNHTELIKRVKENNTSTDEAIKHLEWVIDYTLTQMTKHGDPCKSKLGIIRSTTIPVYNKLKGIES